MAECILQQVGGGVMSDDMTATAENVLASKTYMGADTDDDVGVGTMPNNQSWSRTLDINGTITIPKGYHDGNGKITQSIPTKSATTHRAQTYQQTLVQRGTYCSGDQVLAPVSQNLLASEIKKGSTLRVSNGAENIINVVGSYAPSSKAVMLGIASYNNTNSASFQYTCTGTGVIYCLYDIHSNIKVNGAEVTTANVNNAEGLKADTNYMVQNMSRQASHNNRYPFRFQPIKNGDVVTIVKDQLDSSSQIDIWASVGVMAVVVYD